jgi:hypothetical protein
MPSYEKTGGIFTPYVYCITAVMNYMWKFIGSKIIVWASLSKPGKIKKIIGDLWVSKRMSTYNVL